MKTPKNWYIQSAKYKLQVLQNLTRTQLFFCTLPKVASQCCYIGTVMTAASKWVYHQTNRLQHLQQLQSLLISHLFAPTGLSQCHQCKPICHHHYSAGFCPRKIIIIWICCLKEKQGTKNELKCLLNHDTDRKLYQNYKCFSTHSLFINGESQPCITKGWILEFLNFVDFNLCVCESPAFKVSKIQKF